ncbi:MAG TPA: TolC family protein [Pirellulales bacterium]|jgi:outer membrane protein TolC|nr:TolC family protein [Pirellulales bacterium]
MSRPCHLPWIATASLLLLAAGCAPTQPFYFFEKGDLSHYVGMATKIEAPDVKNASLAEVQDAEAPLTLTNSKYEKVWDLSLEEAVHTALENSKIMRTLGARFASQGGTRPQVGDAPSVLLTTPQSVTSVYDPAIIETNPNLGVEGALSNFDAVLASSFTWEHDNQPQNALLSVGSIQQRISLQDIDTMTTGLSKRSAVGGTYAITSQQIYTDSNSPLRESAHDNQNILDFTLQQRLLRGGGLLFNEINGPLDAGPIGVGNAGNTLPAFRGVMISRINMDISLADFEAGVRNLVDDTENAYWEVYFAYRALAAAEVGRDSALTTWQKIKALSDVNAKGGEADKEAESRNQYFTFRAQVEQALTDLYRMENRLRYLMGLAATDGRLIRPKDEPTTAKVVFDWHDVHEEALARSVELRKEKWKIKQLELELIASKNLLLPNLDFEGRYRLFGLGEDLIRNDGTSYRGTPSESIIGTDATATMANASFREWNLGLNFSMPLGFRKELTQIRSQQLLLTREKNIMQDQELELSHQITDAIRNLDLNYRLMETNFNRRMASEQEVAAVTVAYDAGTVTLDLLLQAQQRRSDAEAAYYRSLIDYNRGIAQVHFVKGSLLEYDDVFLAEGPWPGKAYFDAHRLARARDAGMNINYGYSRPSVFSTGPIAQHADFGGDSETVPGTPTPAEEQIGPGQPSETQPSGAAPNGAMPSGEEPKKSPSSVRKPKALRGDGPMLGSADGIDDAGSIRPLSAIGPASDAPQPSESRSTNGAKSLRWGSASNTGGGAAGDSAGAETSTLPIASTSSSNWHAKN